MVRFVWLSLICCSAVNGLIYAHVKSPGKFIGIFVVLLVCVALVFFHRSTTKKWCEDKWDENSRNDYDEDHFPLFANSLIPLFILAVIACFFSASYAIASITALLFFIIAALREAEYT